MRDSLIDTIFSLHVREYGQQPEVVASSPGLVFFMGEYTEACEGYALSTAIDRRVYVALSLRSDSALYMYDAKNGERKKATLSSLHYKREDRWANYLKSLVEEFAAENYLFLGADITIFSDIPTRLGYHSVTALTTATSLALKQACDIELEDIELARCVANSQKSFMMSLGNVGTVLALLRSREGHLQLMDYETLKSTLYEAPKVDYRILNSQVPVFLDNEELLYRSQAMT